MIEIYRDDQNLWHWQLRMEAGKRAVIARSAEGHIKRSSLLKQLEQVKAMLPGGRVIEIVA